MLLILFVPCKSLANLCFYSGHFTSTEAGQGNTPSCIISQLNEPSYEVVVELEGVNSADGRARQCTQKNSGLRSTIGVHSQFLLNSMKDKEIDKRGLIPPNIR